MSTFSYDPSSKQTPGGSEELVRIHSDGAPSPLGAYAHAVRAGGFVFCAGQGARDPETGREAGVVLDADGNVVRYDISVQTQAALRNLRGVLDAAGTSWDRLVEVNVFLKDMNDFAAMNDVYAREFPNGGPARTTIGVADLPGDNFVEIRAVALA
jgi:2-aminomuconate deaminase